MPRKRNGKKGGGRAKLQPQKVSSTLQLNVFQPRRRIKIATHTLVTSQAPVLALGFDNTTPPGSSLPAVTSLLEGFDGSRVISVTVFFDQRGAGSTGAIPRSTAWIAEDIPAAVSTAKITDLARFAGSGMNQIMPGRPFQLAVGPEFRSGRFELQSQLDTLIIATTDYVGTIRVETLFEAYGPPLDYRVV